MDRAGINKHLLDALEEMPNVKLFFGHRLTGADFRKCQAWFEVKNGKPGPSDNKRPSEIQVDFDLMIGADGAHSAVRYHMMKFSRMNYSQEYIDTLWCEFRIPPRDNALVDDPASRFVISPNHLHIWPGEEFMFIAIPSEVCLITMRLMSAQRCLSKPQYLCEARR
jgi:kynurenine 3-monooxygenase